MTHPVDFTRPHYVICFKHVHNGPLVMSTMRCEGVNTGTRPAVIHEAGPEFAVPKNDWGPEIVFEVKYIQCDDDNGNIAVR